MREIDSESARASAEGTSLPASSSCARTARPPRTETRAIRRHRWRRPRRTPLRLLPRSRCRRTGMSASRILLRRVRWAAAPRGTAGARPTPPPRRFTRARGRAERGTDGTPFLRRRRRLGVDGVDGVRGAAQNGADGVEGQNGADGVDGAQNGADGFDGAFGTSRAAARATRRPRRRTAPLRTFDPAGTTCTTPTATTTATPTPRRTAGGGNRSRGSGIPRGVRGTRPAILSARARRRGGDAPCPSR